ncbi:MAG: cell division protein FtsZ [Chitinophagaceae bacterium]|nr:cell division protein FtsZ [Chitinophagaceae bacterium]
MIHFDMPPQKSNIIKVMGFGGGGGNAVNHMYIQTIQNVDFIVCNTDAQALANSPVPNKVQLGPHLTSGLGAGANPNIGKQATEESLEEIRKMLEVNTKMAFITAGMGGGTGTGGAPIVARICKELGILTVGIVTTPFSFEGPKRMAQAQAGIAELKKHVDTLLVISNDKLRHQFGNLKMKEAFSKADDVLTTAARCITDVINTTGQINVDFSDVCTVMKDGGVAILGSAQMSGENRALEAIEAAVNSPLLNDNDIAGAKWILLNITSASGDHEYTMDEVEIIQNYLLQQTGSDTDIILGMGYDDTLEDKIGITIIATGFHHKDPFAKPEPKKEEEAPPIVMTLGIEGEEKKMENPLPAGQMIRPVMVEPLMPVLNEPESKQESLVLPFLTEEQDTAQGIEETTISTEKPVVFELSLDLGQPSIDTTPIGQVQDSDESEQEINQEKTNAELFNFLHKPSGIYENEDEMQPELKMEEIPDVPEISEPVSSVQPALQFELTEEDESQGMTLSYEEGIAPVNTQRQPVRLVDDAASDPSSDLSEEEMQKRRAQERMARLRNLSFNNQLLESGELDDTPAYLRRNLELHNTLANVEDFYSRATVKLDENNQANISTLNNFLHGEKPD